MSFLDKVNEAYDKGKKSNPQFAKAYESISQVIEEEKEQETKNKSKNKNVEKNSQEEVK